MPLIHTTPQQDFHIESEAGHDIERWSSILLFAVGAIATGATAALLAREFQLGLCLFSIAVFIFTIRRAMFQRRLLESFLVIAFLMGYVLSWCVGLIGYSYVVRLGGWENDADCKYPLLTAALTLLAISSVVAGSWMAALIWSRASEETQIPKFGSREVLPHLLVFGVLFLIYQGVSLSVLGLNARWEIGSEHVTGGSDYWVAGSRSFFLAFYVLLGVSVQPNLSSAWNWTAGLILAGCVGFQAMTGGREYALEPLILYALGSFFSPISWRSLGTFWLAVTPVAAVLMIVIGSARDSAAFSSGSIVDKATEAGLALRGTERGISPENDAFYAFFSRLFETSGQMVIDDVYEHKAFCGWLDFNRLPLVFVPNFVYPQKVPLDDGFERLVAFHGFTYSQFSSSPMTFLADAYERFGIAGVVGFHMAAGALLLILGRLTLKLGHDLFVIVLLICLAKAALRLYPISILGFMHSTCYLFFRDALVLWVLFAIGRLVGYALPSPNESFDVAGDDRLDAGGSGWQSPFRRVR